MPDTRVAAARRTSPGLMPMPSGRGEVDLDLDRRLRLGAPRADRDAVDAATSVRCAGSPARAACIAPRRRARQRPSVAAGGTSSRRSGAHAAASRVSARRRASLVRRTSCRARGSRRRRLDRGHRPVVVRASLHGDPELAGVGADDLVAGDGAADVAATSPTPGTERSSGSRRRDARPSPEATCPAARPSARDVPVLERRAQAAASAGISAIAARSATAAPATTSGPATRPGAAR